MKRFISIVLMVMVLFAAVGAQAEQFQLRNGILFGDTIDDVVAKETTLEREGEESNSFKGKIAGYSNAECTFHFDDDGKLTGMDYWFGSSVCNDRDGMEEIYKALYQSLCRKYGNAIGNTGGTVELITGPAIEKMATWVYFLGRLDGNAGDYADYDEWIVDTDDGHVKIDLVSWYVRDSKYVYSYYVDASYHFYTDADYEAALAEKQGKREEVDNDM